MELLPVLEQLGDIDDEELQVQCDVFLEEQATDEELLHSHITVQDVDLNDMQQVFNALYHQVSRCSVLSIIG